MTKELKISAKEAKRILAEEKVINIDTTSEHELRIVKPYFYGLKYAPSEFNENTPAGVVFFNLMMCYQGAGSVGEGQIENIIWGFRQSGIPNYLTFDGFRDLCKHGYIEFITSEGHSIIGTEPNEKYFFKWKDKFFQMLLEKPEKAPAVEVERVETKDTTWDKVED